MAIFTRDCSKNRLDSSMNFQLGKRKENSPTLTTAIKNNDCVDVNLTWLYEVPGSKHFFPCFQSYDSPDTSKKRVIKCGFPAG